MSDPAEINPDGVSGAGGACLCAGLASPHSSSGPFVTSLTESLDEPERARRRWASPATPAPADRERREG
jgi:hypothetical protein